MPDHDLFSEYMPDHDSSFSTIIVVVIVVIFGKGAADSSSR